jgi:hypothetical protein
MRYIRNYERAMSINFGMEIIDIFLFSKNRFIHKNFSEFDNILIDKNEL